MTVENDPMYAKWKTALDRLSETKIAVESGEASMTDLAAAQAEYDSVCGEINQLDGTYDARRARRSRRSRRLTPEALAVFGSFFIAMPCIMAVAHFLFDVPIYNRDTGQPGSTADLLTVLLTFALVGALLTGIGLADMRTAARQREKIQSRFRN